MSQMPRRCTICDDPRRAEIDAALVSSEVYRAIAKRFSVSESAMYRHRAAHLPQAMVKASQAQEAVQADSLLDQVRSLQERTMTILDTAEDTGNLRVALQAIREARGTVELLARLMGELNSEVTVNVASEWPMLRSTILEALAPHPEAKEAVVAALSEVNA